MALERKLGLMDIFSVASGAMISSGLFILPGLAFAHSGPAVVLAYIIASLLVVPAVFSKSELTTAMPKAGGMYFFIDRSFGPAVGTLGGLSSWFSLSFKSAFALLGMSAFAMLLFPGMTEIQFKLVAVGFCVLFMMINLYSVKHAGRLQNIMVLGLIGLLVVYIFFGFHNVNVHRYAPYIPYGFGSLLATAGLVFISYGGLTKIASLAEEIKDPGRNIPLGMLLSLVIVSILYALVVAVTVGLLPAEQLGVMKDGQFSGSLTPISTGASVFMGTPGLIIMAIAAVLAFVSTANAGIMAASRGPLAMSRDGLLPGFFSDVHCKYGTPYKSIIFTSSFMICVILFLGLENLVKVASTFKIVLFVLANLSVIVMRESKIPNYKPKFKSPLYPWIQIVGILGYGLLLSKMGPVPLIIAGSFFLAGLVWYWLYSHIRINRESALIYLIQRLTSKKLTENILGTELREILRERDDLIEDRFDRMIQDCNILDLNGPLICNDFYKTVAKTVANKMHVVEEDVYNSMVEREKESSTVISPGLAIPHIIIEGHNLFEILVVRCKEGIRFPGQVNPVKIVFALFGSRDERNFHLKALAAIAQIVQELNFEERWLCAQNVTQLRDIILLAQRRRHCV
ncbi:amino acid permease [bacterium]|nr:amino acid permease [bacterium]